MPPASPRSPDSPEPPDSPPRRRTPCHLVPRTVSPARCGAPPIAVPRAGVDPIDGAGRALALIAALVDHPWCDQTVVVLLDRQRRGLGVLVVDGTEHPDRVIEVARFVGATAATRPHLVAAIVASVRTRLGADAAAVLDDVDRWIDLDETLAAAGVELVEWFVISPDGPVSCPRDLLGTPPRW